MQVTGAGGQPTPNLMSRCLDCILQLRAPPTVFPSYPSKVQLLSFLLLSAPSPPPPRPHPMHYSKMLVDALRFPLSAWGNRRRYWLFRHRKCKNTISPIDSSIQKTATIYVECFCLFACGVSRFSLISFGPFVSVSLPPRRPLSKTKGERFRAGSGAFVKFRVPPTLRPTYKRLHFANC